MVDAALRTSTANSPSSANKSPDDTATRIDVDAVGDLLLGTWADLRRKARELAADPRLVRDPDADTEGEADRSTTTLLLRRDGRAFGDALRYGAHRGHASTSRCEMVTRRAPPASCSRLRAR